MVVRKVRKIAMSMAAVLAVASVGVGTAFAGVGAEKLADLYPEQPEAPAHFGQAVTVDGDTAVVGSPDRTISGEAAAGSAYVYTYDGSIWNRQQELTSPDAQANGHFGASVALDGDTLLVGEPTAGGGVVHVFVQSQGMWTLQESLSVIDRIDYLGRSVALEGDTALAGAPMERGDEATAGSVYVFTRSGSTWSQQSRLTASDDPFGAEFGHAVDMDGEVAIVGAPGAGVGGDRGNNAGAAYVFGGAGDAWSQEKKLTSDDPKADGRFGSDVAIDGASFLVGASFTPDPDRPAVGAGSAYVFEASEAGWNMTGRLSACDGIGDSQFGSSVALREGLALVGAPGTFFRTSGDNTDGGAVYAYTSADGSWTHAEKINIDPTTDLGNRAADFGSAMALDGQRLLVGDPGFRADPGGGGSLMGAGRAFAYSVDPSAASGGETVCDNNSSGDTGVGSDAGGGNGVTASSSACSTSGNAPGAPIELLALLGFGLVARRE